MVNSDYQKFVYWMNVKVHIKVMPVKDLLIFFFKMNDVLACNPISFYFRLFKSINVYLVCVNCRCDEIFKYL